MTAKTINDMLRTEEVTVCRFVCPECGGHIHMNAVKFGYGIPDDCKDGPGLVVHFECENLHNFVMEISDHSRSMWVNVREWSDLWSH